jgi:hypothetical protein
MIDLRERTAVLLLISITFISLAGCRQTQPSASPNPLQSGVVTLTFDFQKQSGHASNQFAVWIEDADGGFVKTLYATRFTANGGYKNRPDSIPVWVERSGLAGMADVDAITGATPKSGPLTYTWDLTGADGAPVPDGIYQFFVEGSLRWKNRVLYSEEIDIGGGAVTARAEAQFIYESSDDQPALTDESTEHGMIGPVTAEYTLPEQP